LGIVHKITGSPPIRSLGGACFILALVLYPYVFLLVRVALLEQSENLIHSAKTLGASRFTYLKSHVTFDSPCYCS
ncbi:FbpB, partial [Pasteurella multocida subsp. multocida str. Anand1_cattle]